MDSTMDSSTAHSGTSSARSVDAVPAVAQSPGTTSSEVTDTDAAHPASGSVSSDPHRLNTSPILTTRKLNSMSLDVSMAGLNLVEGPASAPASAVTTPLDMPSSSSMSGSTADTSSTANTNGNASAIANSLIGMRAASLPTPAPSPKPDSPQGHGAATMGNVEYFDEADAEGDTLDGQDEYVSTGGLETQPSSFGALNDDDDQSAFAETFTATVLANFPALTPPQRRALFTSLVEHMCGEDLLHLSQLISPKLRRDFLTDLPAEIALQILSFIDDPKDLVRASRVSRTWRTLVSDEQTWKLMLLKYNTRGWTGGENRTRPPIERIRLKHPEASFGALTSPPPAPRIRHRGPSHLNLARFPNGIPALPPADPANSIYPWHQPHQHHPPPLVVQNQHAIHQQQQLQQSFAYYYIASAPAGASVSPTVPTRMLQAASRSGLSVSAMPFSTNSSGASHTISGHPHIQAGPSNITFSGPAVPAAAERRSGRVRVRHSVPPEPISPTAHRNRSAGKGKARSTEEAPVLTASMSTSINQKQTEETVQSSSDTMETASIAGPSDFGANGSLQPPEPPYRLVGQDLYARRDSLIPVPGAPMLGRGSVPQFTPLLPATSQRHNVYDQLPPSATFQPADYGSPILPPRQPSALPGVGAVPTGSIRGPTNGGRTPIIPARTQSTRASSSSTSRPAMSGTTTASETPADSAGIVPGHERTSSGRQYVTIRSTNPFGHAVTTAPATELLPHNLASKSVEDTSFSYKAQFKKAYLTESNWLRGPGRLLSRQTSVADGVVTSLGFDSEWIVVGMATNQIHVFKSDTGAYVRELAGHTGGVWSLILVSKGGNRLDKNGKKIEEATRTSWDEVPDDLASMVRSNSSDEDKDTEESSPTQRFRSASARPPSTPHFLNSQGFARHLSAELLVGGSQPRSVPPAGQIAIDVDAAPAVPTAPRLNRRPSSFCGVPSASASSTLPLPLSTSGFPFGDANGISSQQAAACGTATGWGQPNAVAVTAGCDRDVRVWDVATGVCKFLLRGHTSTVRCLKVLDGRPIAISGSRDNTLRVWDIEHGELLRLLSGHQHSVRCLEISGNQVVSGSYDTTCRIWDVDTGECLHQLRGHQHQIYAVAFDGVRVASGSLDSTVRIWSAKTGECLALLQGHTSLVGQLQLTDSVLVTGGSDGRVIVFSLSTFECLHRLCAHDNSVTCLQFNDRFMVTGGNDGRVKLWDRPTGKLIRELAEPCEAVWRVTFREDKCVLLCKRGGKTVMDVRTFAPHADEL